MNALSPDKLRRIAQPGTFTFSTTADLAPTANIIGQPRGTRAIEFGIGIQSHGYNIFVMGEMGTGRATAIQRFLHERAQDRKTPGDWVYVHNFRVPHQPRAILLAAGEGRPFKDRMARLILDLKRDLPAAFAADPYQETIAAEQDAFEQQQRAMLQAVEEAARPRGLTLVRTTSGFSLTPAQNGQPLPPEAVQQLTPAVRSELQTAINELSARLQETLAAIYELEMNTRSRMKQIDREVAGTAVQHHFEALRNRYEGQEELLLYLGEVHEDVLSQIDDFAPPVDSTEAIDLRRYEVNVVVDNSQTHGAPVILDNNPSYHGLFGRLEYEVHNGHLTTHFTNIKCGSLQQANGGYLIINAHDLLQEARTWEALKRALKAAELRVEPLSQLETNKALAKSLDPEPIPLTVKVVLLGSPELYYTLHERDMDFGSLFKVRADFDETMPRSAESEQAYAQFVATRCHEEGALHFDQEAVAKVIEFGARLADHQCKLTTRFGAIADLVREAGFWAKANGRSAVTAVDVQQALRERVQRANRVEQLIFEQILEGNIFIATDGEVIGQVNGLSVLDTGEYAFGQPGRITARTFMGNDGVMHIERETDMSGPIHHKGVLTLNGYLGGTYAQNQPLSLNASLTFEQNYVGIDGDSASSGELYTLLSSLSRIPLKQGIAVTGSVNQRGEIQPIGGVNEKIEGFFRLCEARGLTGEQGVLIPASNEMNLMLDEAVVTAVAQGQFHVWSIDSIDEGIEMLMGMTAGKRKPDGTFPEGTVHHAVQTRLRRLAEDLNKFGDNDDEDDDDDKA